MTKTRAAQVDLMIERMRAAWVSDGSGVQAERDAFLALSAGFPEPASVDERWGEYGSVPALTTTPLGFDESADPTVVYLHGGAFLIGAASIYRYQSSRVATAARAQVVTVDYRLAPEHPFPAAVDDAVRAYSGLLEAGLDPARSVVAGDSAGGNLALAAALRLRDAGAPLPAGLVLLSPWVDLTCSGASMETNADPRHLAQRQSLLFSAGSYLAGTDPRTPLASPLFGDLSGLPPALIQVGALETLLDESLDLERKLSAAGGDVTLHVYDGMVHEWHLLSALLEPGEPLNDADDAIDELAAFVRATAAR